MELEIINQQILSEFRTRLRSSKKLIAGYFVLATIIGLIWAPLAHANSVRESASWGNSPDPMSYYIAKGLLTADLGVPLTVLLLIVVGIIFWYPSTVAKKRGHAYKGLIQLLNIAALFTGISWFIAAAWAIFPSEKSLIDPFVGNPTGTGRRNAGDTIGSAKHGQNRGIAHEASTDEMIDKLIDMHSKGLITDDEFARKKKAIIQRDY